MPVGLTGCHQVVLWIASSIYLRCKKQKSGGEEHDETLTSAQLREHQSNRSHQFWRYILPTAIFSAGDIGFGNMSLRYVPLTVHIIVKSSSIVFVLLFSCLFKIERFHWRLFGIVVCMAAGVCMMVYKPVGGTPGSTSAAAEEENARNARFFFGCMLVLLSSCLSGLRWVYTQLILRNQTHRSIPEQEEEGKAPGDDSTVAPGTKKNNPIRTINSLSPIMAATLFLTSLLLERPLEKLRSFSSSSSTGLTVGTVLAVVAGLMVLPGCCVLAFTWCEFTILRVTRVLTLSVAGIVKEVLTIVLSMLVLKERLHGVLNWLGMVTILVDVMYYNYFRYTEGASAGASAPAAGDTAAAAAAAAAQQDIPLYSVDSTCQEYQIDQALRV